MDTKHYDVSAAKALAERKELFRYADLNHPLVALLFTDASLDHILPDESETAWD